MIIGDTPLQNGSPMKAILLSAITVFASNFYYYSQREDSLYKSQELQKPLNENRADLMFQKFTGGLNSLIQDSRASGSFDLSVQTYHYYLVTARRYKNDSMHYEMQKRETPIHDLYKGFHFYLLNRAAIDFDSLRSIANNYITSLLGSPLTIRIDKELFLTKARKITASSLTPVLSLVLTGDSRLIPFGNRDSKMNVGASGHLYLSFSALFKRVEFDAVGRELDNGVMYLRPIFGIAYGTKELMQSVIPGDKLRPIITTGCRVGFKSEINKLSDFSFLLNYSLSDIIGPKLRAGITFGTGS